jgi:hypothetical protein
MSPFAFSILIQTQFVTQAARILCALSTRRWITTRQRFALLLAASIAAPKSLLNFIKKNHTCFYSSTSGFRSSTSLLSLFSSCPE